MIRFCADIPNYCLVFPLSEIVPLSVLMEQGFPLLLVDLVPYFSGTQLVEVPQFTQLTLPFLLVRIELFGLLSVSSNEFVRNTALLKHALVYLFLGSFHPREELSLDVVVVHGPFDFLFREIVGFLGAISLCLIFLQKCLGFLQGNLLDLLIL